MSEVHPPLPQLSPSGEVPEASPAQPGAWLWVWEPGDFPFPPAAPGCTPAYGGTLPGGRPHHLGREAALPAHQLPAPAAECPGESGALEGELWDPGQRPYRTWSLQRSFLPCLCSAHFSGPLASGHLGEPWPLLETSLSRPSQGHWPLPKDTVFSVPGLLFPVHALQTRTLWALRVPMSVLTGHQLRRPPTPLDMSSSTEHSPQLCGPFLPPPSPLHCGTKPSLGRAQAPHGTGSGQPMLMNKSKGHLSPRPSWGWLLHALWMPPPQDLIVDLSPYLAAEPQTPPTLILGGAASTPPLPDLWE